MAPDRRPLFWTALVAGTVLALAVVYPAGRASANPEDALPEWVRNAPPIPHTSPDPSPSVGAGAAVDGAGSELPPPPVRAEIRVGPGGTFSSIEAAVAAALPHAVIRVGPGVYPARPLVLDRPVHLIGEGWPVLDGEGVGSIVVVQADSVRIQGFVLTGTGKSYTQDHAAILIEEHRACEILDNRVDDTFFGIYLARTTDCEVRGNRVRSNATREADSGNGIHLWDVERIRVSGNEVSGHRDGVYLEFARSVILRNNTSEGNLRYGLHFMFSDDSFFQDNVFRANGAGVAVMYTRNVVMSGNRFEQNWGPAVYGLLIKDVQDALVEGNLFRQNSVGLFVEGADRVTFRMNDLERNGWAVRILGSSQDNHFTANNFIENTFDVTTNTVRSDNTFDRNYWSAYRGYDLSGDGFGEVPHRPVRLFSVLIERQPPTVLLLRSFFVDVLEVAERVLPVLTPDALVDPNPRIRKVVP
jgi:nitrous oxidase accessory protein